MKRTSINDNIKVLEVMGLIIVSIAMLGPLIALRRVSQQVTCTGKVGSLKVEYQFRGAGMQLGTLLHQQLLFAACKLKIMI